MTTIKQLTQENDKLRLLLATSKADCAYCGLPAEAMAKCASGFPGCSRADDILSDGTPTRQDLIDARDALAAQNVRLREALERVITITEHDNVDSYMLDVHEAERVLALPLPDAVREVETMREKAGLLDWAESNAASVKYRWFEVDHDRRWGVVYGDWEDRKAVLARSALAALRAAKGEK